MPGHSGEHRPIVAGGKGTRIRDHRDKIVKRLLDAFHIRVDISVIELKRRNQGMIGFVMKELGTFVEKCCVVFVPFDDEVAPLSQTVVRLEIQGNATHQKGGFQPGFRQHPGGQRRSRGLSVGARNDQGGSVG